MPPTSALGASVQSVLGGTIAWFAAKRLADQPLPLVCTVLASPKSASLEASVRALAGALENLVAGPLDPIRRQRAVDAALGALWLVPTGIERELGVLAARNFAVALMVVLSAAAGHPRSRRKLTRELAVAMRPVQAPSGPTWSAAASLRR